MGYTERNVIHHKCRELWVKFSPKERLATLKKKLTNFGVDANALVSSR